MTEPNVANGREKEHELSALGSLASGSAQTLRSHWITTVEQLVATAATEQGRKGLESLLGGARASVDVLLRESRELLGTQRYEVLMQGRPGGPLGARFDDPAFKTKSSGSKGGAA